MLDKRWTASVRTVNAIHRLLMDRNSLTAVSPSPPILSRSATPQFSPDIVRPISRSVIFSAPVSLWAFFENNEDFWNRNVTQESIVFFRKVPNLTWFFYWWLMNVLGSEFHYQSVLLNIIVIGFYQSLFFWSFTKINAIQSPFRFFVHCSSQV